MLSWMPGLTVHISTVSFCVFKLQMKRLQVAVLEPFVILLSLAPQSARECDSAKTGCLDSALSI